MKPGGQFFGWRFFAKGHLLMSHPFSLSAAPTQKHLRITVKDLGDHSRSLALLKPGTRVFVEGPYGAFTAGRSTRPHVVLVGQSRWSVLCARLLKIWVFQKIVSTMRPLLFIRNKSYLHHNLADNYGHFFLFFAGGISPLFL